MSSKTAVNAPLGRLARSPADRHVPNVPAIQMLSRPATVFAWCAARYQDSGVETLFALDRQLGDIAPLARHLLARIARQPGLRPLGITDDALHLLAGYDWPGNVRQLGNALFRAAVLCDGDALTAADFPQIAAMGGRREATTAAATAGGITLYRPDGNLRPLEDIEAGDFRRWRKHHEESFPAGIAERDDPDPRDRDGAGVPRGSRTARGPRTHRTAGQRRSAAGACRVQHWRTGTGSGAPCRKAEE